MITYHCGPGYFWFRLFGAGLSFIDDRLHRRPFSVRYGYRRVLTLGHWRIELLKP